MVRRSPVHVPQLTPTTLPFGHSFQRALLRLICEDGGFAHQMAAHLEPHYFENEVLAWAYAFAQQHYETYGGMPSLSVIRDSVRHIDPRLHQKYHVVLDQVVEEKVKDEQWLRDQIVVFAKRNIYIEGINGSRHLFNAGKIDESYDYMMERMDKLTRTTWEVADEEVFYEELPRRQNDRFKDQGAGGGVPTGFPWLDHVLDGGLAIGEMGIWVAYAKHGKALRDDQRVLTPGGFVRIDMLREGSAVIGGSSGAPQTVTGVFPQGDKSLYRIAMRDGAEVVASGDHIWTVQTRRTVQRKESAWVDVTTRELAAILDEDRDVWIPDTPLVQGGVDPVGLDPYLFGLLLGDGGFTDATVRFTKPEKDLWDSIERRLPAGDSISRHGAADYISIIRKGTRERSQVALELERLGLLGKKSKDKWIPDAMFAATPQYRRGLLSGLCDTDGHVTTTGCMVEFSSASHRLAAGVQLLARSLGGQAAITTKTVDDTDYWLVRLRLPDSVPVRSTKNRAKIIPRTKRRNRHVQAVELVEPGYCTCITVDDPQALFITEGHIVTHNSTMLIQHGIAATKLAHVPTAHFVLEGSRKMVSNRYDAALLDELYTNVKRGNIDEKKYAEGWAKYQSLRDLLVIRGFTDKWNYNAADLHQALKEMKLRGFDPDMLIVDYGDLLHGREKRYHSETDRQKAAFEDLKSLANRGYALWTASQAQRPGEDMENKKHEIKARMIARCWEKVCIGDFTGSINMTLAERRLLLMRLHAEWYRDNEADSTKLVRADLPKMTIKEEGGLVSPHQGDDDKKKGTVTSEATPTIGYRQTQVTN